MGCGSSSSTGVSKQNRLSVNITSPATLADPKVAANLAPLAGNPEFENQVKAFGNVYARLNSTKTKASFAAICSNGEGLEMCVVMVSGDIFLAVFNDTELASKRETLMTTWGSFFKFLKSSLRKCTVKQSGLDTVILHFSSEKGQSIAFSLKNRGKDVTLMHRIFLTPLFRLYGKAKNGDDSRYTRIEVETSSKLISLKDSEEKSTSLQNTIRLLSQRAKQASDEAKIAREQKDGVRKRIHKMINLNNKDRDHLYPVGPYLYPLHTPHSKEHIPKIIPFNRSALHTIVERYGGDSTFYQSRAEPGPSPERIMKILSKIDDWDFDVFSLHKETNGGSLFMVSFALLYKYGLIKQFSIDEQILLNFLQAMESGYHPNPYHNAMHAADVMQITHYIVDPGGLKQTINMTANDCFAALLSAAIHDYDHPGFNNNFHIRTSSWLAILYNDRSVLENHHLAQIFDLVKSPKYNIFATLTAEQYKDIRDTILEMVLSTDMGLHAKIYQCFRRRTQEEKEWVSREDQRLALSIAIKMADISNCCRPAHLYREWAKNIAEEFYNQGDAESKLNLTVSPFMDRRKDKADFPKGQISFMNYIVIPLFEAAAALLPKLQFTVEEAARNKQELLTMQQSGSFSVTGTTTGGTPSSAASSSSSVPAGSPATAAIASKSSPTDASASSSSLPPAQHPRSHMQSIPRPPPLMAPPK